MGPSVEEWLGNTIGTIQGDSKDGLNFVRLYFLNYTCFVNNLHKI